jgi:hypothetical protein
VPARAARMGFASVGGGGGAEFGNAIPGAAKATKARGNIDVGRCIIRVGVIEIGSRSEFESDLYSQL